MKKIISFILMTVISMNYCLFNFPLEVFAQNEYENISSIQGSKEDENERSKEDEKQNEKVKTQIKLNENSINLEIGKEHKLDYEIITENNKDAEDELIFISSDETKATVEDGVIKAIDVGKAFIKIATKDNEVIKSCEVSVIDNISSVNGTLSEDMHEIVLEKEKNYEIVNKSMEQIKLDTKNNYKYDNISYYQDNSISDIYRNNYGDIYLNKSSKIKLSIKSEDISFFVPISKMDYIDVLEIEGPIIYEGVLKANTAYEVKSTIKDQIVMRSVENVYYSKIIYYSKSESISSVYRNDYGSLWTYKDRNTKIELKDKDMRYYIATEEKDSLLIKEIEGPIIYEGVLKANTAYEVKSTIKDSIYMNSIGNVYYSEIMYSTNGTMASVYNNQFGSLWTYKDRSKKIELKDKDMRYYIATEEKDSLLIKEIEGPIIYEGVLEANTAYEVKSTIKDSIYMNSIGNVYYSEIMYNTNGNISNVYKNEYGSLWTYKDRNKKIELKDKDMRYYIATEEKDSLSVKEIEGPIIYEGVLEANKTYEISNNLNNKIEIKNNSSSNKKYDYIKYKSDGSYRFYGEQYGSLSLDKNEKIIISPSDTNIESIGYYFPNEYIKGVQINELGYGMEDIFDILPKVEVSITKQLSKPKDSVENFDMKDYLSSYYITLYNETQKKSINGIQIKNESIVLPENTTKPGDNLTISLENKSKDSNIAKVSVKLDSNNKGKISVEIQQLGYVKIDYKENNDTLTNRTLIFNSNGDNIKTISTKPNEMVKSGYLKPSRYTIILLKSNGELWRLNNLKEFNERGFVENKDYIKYTIDIKDGVIEEIKPTNIPVVDEDRLSFFDKSGTLFTTNTESVVEGGLLEIRLQYKFKNQYTLENIKKKSININLPDQLTFIDNSVVIDNNKSNYNHNNNSLSVPIENMSGVIKFNVRPIESKNIQIRAESKFTYNNRSITEILGIVTADINCITLNGPSETSSKTVELSGIARPNAIVSIYDKGNKIGETKSLSSGKWRMKVDLFDFYFGSSHQVVAKIDENTNKSNLSNVLNIKYKKKAPTVNKFIFIYENKKIDLTDAIKKGESPLITFLNSKRPYTFEMDIENSKEIDKLYVTSDRNSERKKMEATYDEKNNKWIATGHFDPNDKYYVPGTLNIEYTLKDKTNFTQDDIVFSKELLPKEWREGSVEIIENSKSKQVLEINLNNKYKSKLTLTVNESKLSKKYKHNDFKAYEFVEFEYEGKTYYGRYDEIKSGNDYMINATFLDPSIEHMIEVVLKENSGYGSTGMSIIGEVKDIIDNDNQIKNLREHINSLDISQSEKNYYINEISTISNSMAIYSMFAMVSSMTLGIIGMAYGGPVGAACVAIGVGISIFKNIKEIIDSMEIENLMMFAQGLKPRWKIDPSGYVYEAIDLNRVEGVTTTVYYKDEDTGEAVKWYAEEFDQKNPLTTDKDGKYAWDVPEGLWQVKYEKEGYKTTYSEWLPVPPPQTEVNIEIVSYEKPKIEMFNIYKDRAEITFNKYMDVSTINNNSVVLKDSNGKNISFSIESIDADETKDKKVVANKFVLKANTKKSFKLANEYKIIVKPIAKTYAGIGGDNDIIASTIYKPLPTKINAGDSYSIGYKQQIKIPVSIDNISGVSDFTLTANSSMDDIVSIPNSKVNFDKHGKINIDAIGMLPGETTIILGIEGLDLTKEVTINVTMNDMDDPKPEPPKPEPPKIEFKDIKGHWAEAQINKFVSQGYIAGYSDGTFRPNNNITRAEFVKILNKVFGLTKSSGKVFEDTKNHWARTEIDIAITNGVCNGKTTTEFKPNDYTTREEVSVMIANYKKISDKNHNKINGYSDGKKVSNWAKNQVEAILEKGYMGGYSDNTFRPKNNITRAEAVATLGRVK